jgi:hypothetical protein
MYNINYDGEGFGWLVGLKFNAPPPPNSIRFFLIVAGKERAFSECGYASAVFHLALFMYHC